MKIKSEAFTIAGRFTVSSEAELQSFHVALLEM